jgi:predicted phage terminase large subunit-like protein
MTCTHATLRTLAGGACPICPADDLGPIDLDALDDDERALRRSILIDSFDDFVARYWHLVAPRAYEPNVATTAMIAALQAVADGRIRRLVIEIGPGLAKSTLLSLYAAWRYARDSAHRAIHASYAYEIAANNSRRARRVVESPDFRALFEVALSDDDNTVAHWSTTRHGRYVAAGVGGALTGHRAAELIVDDPINAIDALSKAARDTTASWFNESATTRVDGDGPIIVVGQRLGVDDLIGRLKSAGGWTALTLPVEYDDRRRCVLVDDHGVEVWRDPRDTDGELLAPTVLGRDKLERLRAQIGSIAFASQYLQNPSTDDAATIRRSWWRFYRVPGTATGARRPAGTDDAPAVPLPDRFERIVITADLTFGSAKGDYCAIQAWGSLGGGRYLLRAFRKRCGFEEQVATIKSFAREYPRAKIVVEKAANGAAAIETLRKAIPNVTPSIPRESKEARLAGVAPIVEGGTVYLPDTGAKWIVEFVEELAGATKHDDAADACAYALLTLQGDATGIERTQRLLAAARAFTGYGGVPIRRTREELLRGSPGDAAIGMWVAAGAPPRRSW